MDEVVDILDDKGNLIGKNVEKLEAHKNGICHGISAVAIVNSEGKVLLQKRALTKIDAPGKWDLSATGHISSGELVNDGAIRETFEEIGIEIKADELNLIDAFLYENKEINIYIKHYIYLFIVKKDITLDMITMQETEVSEVKFVDKQEFINMLENGEMVNPMSLCKKIFDYMK